MNDNLKMALAWEAAREVALTEKILVNRSQVRIWTSKIGIFLWYLAWELLEISYKLSFCSYDDNRITKI